MPVPLPNLDDRTYADLTAEARALLPNLLPAWTDHNPSDPGIVLVELLAWLTEMLLFQVDQVPPASTEAFLDLLGGPQRAPTGGAGLDEAVQATLRSLRERYRAVTPDDYEHLVLHAWPATEAAASLAGGGRIARVRCVAQRDLAGAGPVEPAPAHVSVVVVPEPAGDERHPQPAAELRTALAAFLDPRRLLTTRIHVVGPSYVEVGVAANVVLRADAPVAEPLDAAHRALAAFLDPLTGGTGGTGWPFGRDVHVADVYAVLEQVPSVDYVEEVRLTGPRPAADDGEPSIRLEAHELVRLGAVELAGYDASGRPLTAGRSTP